MVGFGNIIVPEKHCRKFIGQFEQKKRIKEEEIGLGIFQDNFSKEGLPQGCLFPCMSQFLLPEGAHLSNPVK